MGFLAKPRNVMLMLIVLTAGAGGSGLLLSHATRYKGLHFQQNHLDLGELDYDTEIQATFPFKNTGPKLISIKKVKADCRCTLASAGEQQVYPGESGSIDVTFRSSNESGPEKHEIVVVTDPPSPELIKLTISAVVDPKIEIIPRAISFGRVKQAQTVSARTVAVVSRFRGPAEIVGISTSSPYLKAAILDEKQVGSREVARIKIALLATALPGRLDSRVVVETRTEAGVIHSSIRILAEIV
ncbi:MAG: DUF1573 domain-containing protein [Planctomycetota bacterium]|jgi:hypothetical protein